MAKALLDDVTEDNEYIIAQAAIADVNSQSGLNQLIIEELRKNGGVCHVKELKRRAVNNGNDANKIQPSIDMMLSSGLLEIRNGFVTETVHSNRNLRNASINN